jgi:phage FluMu gp28-like protein
MSRKKHSEPKKPMDFLLPYQRAWVKDESRFKIWNASRQIGKSFAAACEAVRDCYLHPGAEWVVLSAGERQSLEFMEKVRMWVKAFDLTIAQELEERDSAEAVLKSAEIRLANGSRVLALPANPATARGYSANLILDEFAFHKDSTAIWRGIYPSIANPLKRELKVRVLSTPNGQANKFYELWSDDAGSWKRHRTTIHDAKADGLPVNIEDLRKQAGDADTWRQEFECEFIDTARAAFSYEMLAACESPEATMQWGFNAVAEGSLFVGVDVGSIHDPTVGLTLEKRGELLFVRDVVRVQGLALSEQDAILDPLIGRAAMASIDASGIGLDLAQRMQMRHGRKVTAQPVTAKWKRQAFSHAQRMLSDKSLLIPANREFREDLHAYQVYGAGETATFRAPRTEEGHSDMASALVHALDAAKQAVANYGAILV